MAGTAPRFGGPIGRGASLGPGDYDVTMPWMRRTFNITVAEQEMVAATQAAV